MKTPPLFPKNSLDHYLPDFRLASITGIRDTTLKISGLIDELKSGKIASLKEEEFKPRFINTFFGDVLGFNYGNANFWQLRDEKKSMTDGTKADAVLGFFEKKKNNDDVRVVIEIKDATTDLDQKQNRAGNQTSVEQAFSYVPKMGGKCKWVIVSNFVEIRFYKAGDSTKYQVFFINELLQEEKLKQLLYLFHKDRFVHVEDMSPTEKLLLSAQMPSSKREQPQHIIDKLYHSLKRFDRLGFVDPNYLATIYPFNILNEYVWHYYNRELFTINPDIYEFMTNVIVENNSITFTPELQKGITEANIVEAREKVEWIFTFLNRSHINEITAIKDYKEIEAKNKSVIGFSIRHIFSLENDDEGITKKIQLKKPKSCDCLICNYRNFDFVRLLDKLKTAEGNADCDTLEYAYAHYLVASNNFKSTYTIYKNLERELKGKEGKAIQYFLTKQNIKYLHNLALDYDQNDSNTIMNDIKSVDLDKVIYDEIEFAVDKEVKQYLIDLKEDILIYKLQDEIDECLSQVGELERLYSKGGWRTAGPNIANKLLQKYYILYAHINANFIVCDIFNRYRSLAEKFVRGIVTLSAIPKLYDISFNDFILTEAILHVQPDALQTILKLTGNLKTEDGTIEKMLIRLKNYTNSIYKDGAFVEPHENTILIDQLHNYRFEDKFSNIFSNLFTVLSHLDITIQQFGASTESIIKFLKIENVMGWFNIEKLANFIYEKGYLFSEKQLLEILTIAVNGHKYGGNKYVSLLENIPQTLLKYYPNCKINNTKLVKAVILNSHSEDGKHVSYMDLIPLVNACDSNCKQIIFSAFEEYLDTKFKPEFYEKLILNSEYDYNTKGYFQLYANSISQKKGTAYKYGKLQLTDLIFINFIILICVRKIDVKMIELGIFTDLNDFENWLLNPLSFDYSRFEVEWLQDANIPSFLENIKGHQGIASKIEVYLKKEYNPDIAKLKYQYFS